MTRPEHLQNSMLCVPGLQWLVVKVAQGRNQGLRCTSLTEMWGKQSAVHFIQSHIKASNLLKLKLTMISESSTVKCDDLGSVTELGGTMGTSTILDRWFKCYY